MNFAISNIAWKNHENSQIYELLKEFKIKGLEIAPGILIEEDNPYDLNKESLLNIKKSIFNSFDLNIISMQSLLYGTKDLQLFSDSKPLLKQYMKKAIKFSSYLGVKNLVFGSPKNRLKKSLTTTEAIKLSSPLFFDLAEYARDMGTTLSIEANAKEYGADFIVNNAEAMQLIKEVNHPNFRLNYDSSTIMLNQENYVEFIHDNCDYINHVHFSTPFLEPVPGDSIDFFKDLYNTLNKCSYKNYISIEMKSKSDKNNLKHVYRALQFLNNLQSPT